MSRPEENVIILESDDDDAGPGIDQDDGDIVFVKTSQLPVSPICIKTDDEDDEEDIIFVSVTKPRILSEPDTPTWDVVKPRLNSPLPGQDVAVKESQDGSLDSKDGGFRVRQSQDDTHSNNLPIDMTVGESNNSKTQRAGGSVYTTLPDHPAPSTTKRGGGTEDNTLPDLHPAPISIKGARVTEDNTLPDLHPAPISIKGARVTEDNTLPDLHPAPISIKGARVTEDNTLPDLHPAPISIKGARGTEDNTLPDLHPAPISIKGARGTEDNTLPDLHPASMTVCDDILNTNKTPTSMLCGQQADTTRSQLGGSTNSAGLIGGERNSTVEELQAFLPDLFIENDGVTRGTTWDSGQGAGGPLLASRAVAGTSTSTVSATSSGQSNAMDLARTPRMVLSVSDILNSSSGTDAVSTSDRSTFITSIFSDALNATGVTGSLGANRVSDSGTGDSNNTSGVITLPTSSSSTSFSSSSSSSSSSTASSQPQPLSSSFPLACSTSLPSDLAGVIPQPLTSTISPCVLPLHHVSADQSSRPSLLVVPTVSSSSCLGTSLSPTQQSSGLPSQSHVSFTASNPSLGSLTTKPRVGSSHSVPSSPVAIVQPVFKRSVSYMQSDPNQNHIPLKKRKRLQRRTAKTAGDSTNTAVSLQTGGSKCSFCQNLVCFSRLSHCLQGHGCCGDCLQQKVKTLLSKAKQGSLKCPLTSCASYFPMSQLQQTLPPMVVEILEEKLDREYIDYAADLVWQNLGESPGGRGGEEEDEDDVETDTETGEGGESVAGLSKEPSLVALPSHWDPMDDPSGFKKVTLVEGSVEYEEIFNSFDLSMGSRYNRIISISRIQNPILWQFYSMRRMQMVMENGGEAVLEKQLCHGTSNNVVDAICKSNFDWRLCGAHGTLYGQGSYFARDAAYSHLYTDNARSYSQQARLRRQTQQMYQLRLQYVQDFHNQRQRQRHQPLTALLPKPPPAHQKAARPSSSSTSAAGQLANSQSQTAGLFTTGLLKSAQPAPVASTSTGLVGSGPSNNRLMMLASLLGGVYSQNSTDLAAQKVNFHSMFIAKVLVGQYTHGKTQYRKPPPLDVNQPFGRCYDTCVDNICEPKIFVVFDSAQSYPEYLIEYTTVVAQSGV